VLWNYSHRNLLAVLVKRFRPGKKDFVFAGQNLFWAEKILFWPDKIFSGQNKFSSVETFSGQMRLYPGESGREWPNKVFFLPNMFRLAAT
jgi:hypothetical protein